MDMNSEFDKKAKTRYRDLTETPVPQLILRLSVPTIISMLVTAIYNAADTFFVGKISTEATAAVGLAFSMMAVIQALGFFCGQGSGNYLSRMLGAGRRKEAEEMAATGLALSILLGIMTAAVSIWNIRSLVVFLGATESTIENTVSYLRIIVLGAPFMMGQFVVNNQLRFQGSALYAMVGLLCGAILNIALDPLLILVFQMGVTGAAIATVCGQIISFFVLLAGSMHGSNIRLRIRNIHINGHYLFEIVPSGTGGSCYRTAEPCGWRLWRRGYRWYERNNPRHNVCFQCADRIRAGLSAGLCLQLWSGKKESCTGRLFLLCPLWNALSCDDGGFMPLFCAEYYRFFP